MKYPQFVEIDISIIDRANTDELGRLQTVLFLAQKRLKQHPRVRRKRAGKEEKAVLNSYKTAQNRDELNRAMMRALIVG